IELRNHRIGDVQHQPQVIKLARELSFRLTRPLVIERVVNGDRHLIGDLNQQLLVVVGKKILALAGDAQYAQLSSLRDQRNAAARSVAILVYLPDEIGIESSQIGFIQEDRLT